jgi:CheY-like chemotaxis protein
MDDAATRKRVMFVDDDPINNRMHELLIKGLCPHVTVIKKTSVDDAVSYLSSNPNALPVCIFLDLNLPGKDGWQFIEEFKPLKLDIDIYLLTSSIDLFSRDILAIHPEVKKFLEKPLQEYQLMPIIC